MDGDDFVFMDMTSYEETRLTAKQIGESRKYLKEGMEVNVVSWNEKPLEVELPNSVILEIKKLIQVSKVTLLLEGQSLQSWKQELK